MAVEDRTEKSPQGFPGMGGFLGEFAAEPAELPLGLCTSEKFTQRLQGSFFASDPGGPSLGNRLFSL